ncbi:MAG: 2-dehydropantoate 2-reductase [Chloroflexi bacterium]|nr:2-dehydropantoate 2-reductase [Chloroflexota bacterium]
MGKRLAFMGAGAVGSYVGGHLTRAGEDVTLIDPWPDHIEAIERDGLMLEGTQGEYRVHPWALHLHEVQSLFKAPVDIAFVCTKSYDTVWATTMIAQYLAPGGYIVSLQNSINEERIASVVGWGRVLGCIASSISVNAYAPGHVTRTVQPGGPGYTVFRVGEVHGRITPRAEEIAALMSNIDSAKVTPNLWGERWTKLVLNASGNGVSAITGLGGKEMTLSAEIRRLTIQLTGEAIAVGQALGFEIEPIRGLPPAVSRAAAEGDAAAFEQVEGKMLAGLARMTEDGRPSTGQDIQKGRRTEIDFLNGLVAEKGDEAGVPTPTHKALVQVVKEVERREVEASPSLVERVWELAGIRPVAIAQPAR